MIWHSEAVGGGVPDECTCPRQECGAVIETHGCPWHHPQRAGMHHPEDRCGEIQARRAIRAAGNAAAQTIVNRIHTKEQTS
jgi:hypothetical protein